MVYHGGVEYVKYPAPYFVKEFKLMIDAGADAVVSHHTHRYSGILNYNGGVLVFGLGNFYSPTSVKHQPKEWYRGIVLKLEVNRNEISSNFFLIELDDQTNKVEYN